jgi:hypothetical protein
VRWLYGLSAQDPKVAHFGVGANRLETAEDSMAVVAAKIAELVAVEVNKSLRAGPRV